MFCSNGIRREGCSIIGTTWLDFVIVALTCWIASNLVCYTGETISCSLSKLNHKQIRNQLMFLLCSLNTGCIDIPWVSKYRLSDV